MDRKVNRIKYKEVPSFYFFLPKRSLKYKNFVCKGPGKNKESAPYTKVEIKLYRTLNAGFDHSPLSYFYHYIFIVLFSYIFFQYFYVDIDLYLYQVLNMLVL